jgi:hypothetical protein
MLQTKNAIKRKKVQKSPQKYYCVSNNNPRVFSRIATIENKTQQKVPGIHNTSRGCFVFSFQASEFFMFAGLLFVDTIIFAVMAYYFQYVDMASLQREREAEEEAEKLKAEEELKKGNNNNGGVDNRGFVESANL